MGSSESDGLIFFPAHSLLIVEERLREQEAEGRQDARGKALDELALRVLIAAELAHLPDSAPGAPD